MPTTSSSAPLWTVLTGREANTSRNPDRTQCTTNHRSYSVSHPTWTASLHLCACPTSSDAVPSFVHWSESTCCCMWNRLPASFASDSSASLPCELSSTPRITGTNETIQVTPIPLVGSPIRYVSPRRLPLSWGGGECREPGSYRSAFCLSLIVIQNGITMLLFLHSVVWITVCGEVECFDLCWWVWGFWLLCWRIGVISLNWCLRIRDWSFLLN